MTENKKYHLYLWYAWGFGNHWYFSEASDSIEALKNKMKNQSTATWKIVDSDGQIADYHIAQECYWRYGMSKPNIQAYSDGRIVEYHKEVF